MEPRLCLSAAPAVSNLALQNDTGDPTDLITRDPAIAGTATGEDFTYIDVEIDLDGDGQVDEWLTVNSGGSFAYDPTGYVSYGEVTIHVRTGAYDDDGIDYLYSNWGSITFTYEAPPPPVVSTLGLKNDTGDPTDLSTRDPAITGTVVGADFSYFDVEIDLDGDGQVDEWLTADSGGNFVYDPTGYVNYGEVTIYVRAGACDDDAGMDYFYSDWVSITFTYEAPPPPVVSSLTLQNDTGQSGDMSTEDPSVAGTVAGEDFSYFDVEIDLDGDGQADEWLTADSGGNFAYDPTGYISYGEVTIYVRAGAWDDDTGMDYFYSDWVSITFTYVAPPPPAVSSMDLQNDTGDSGDLATTDPTITGSVTGDAQYFDLEIDFDGDGYSDDWTSTDSSGNFVYDPSGNVGYGEITIYVRAGAYDDTGMDYFYSDWIAITFTYLEQV